MQKPGAYHQLFTPHSRTLIAREIASRPTHEWKGTRRGVRAAVRLNPMHGDTHRVLWSATPAEPAQGKATTVFDALLCIEAAASKARTQERKDTPTPCRDNQTPLPFSGNVTSSTRRIR